MKNLKGREAVNRQRMIHHTLRHLSHQRMTIGKIIHEILETNSISIIGATTVAHTVIVGRSVRKQQPEENRRNKIEKQANLATDLDKSSAVSFFAIINGKRDENDSTRILDSGASVLTKDEKLLRNTKLLTQPTKIRIAKAGTTLTANKVGTICGKTIVNGKEIGHC